MRQLSGLDAGFLALETARAPMTIGGLSILDPRTPDGRLDLDRFRRRIASRLDRAIAFRRRLAAVPLDLARPYWVELAPGEVDPADHVERTALPAPGGWHELAELVAFELSRPLPRDRPLWSILFVEGLDRVPGAPEGAVGLVSRVHHAAIDGVSGAEILGALFDGVGEAAPPGGAAGAPVAEREPGVLELAARAGRDLAAAPLTAGRTLGRSLLGLAGSTVSRLSGEAPLSGKSRAPLPFAAPRTPINRTLDGHRAWAPAFWALSRLKAIKDAERATVNDVVLTLAAAALRGWLVDRDELPEEPLVAMVPVSVRGEEERTAAGNRVSAMLVELATDEAEPLARLRRIRDAARRAKRGLAAVGARTLADSTDLFPFALSGLAARLYSRLHLADRHRPPFNLVITNVPGPPRRLAIDGAPLLAHVGAAPLFDGLAMILPVFSYAGTVSVGVTADRELLPDAWPFAARLEAALDELEDAVDAPSA